MPKYTLAKCEILRFSAQDFYNKPKMNIVHPGFINYIAASITLILLITLHVLFQEILHTTNHITTHFFVLYNVFNYLISTLIVCIPM